MVIMTVQEILEMVVEDRGPIFLVFVILMTVIEITPIKINPWTALFGWLGKQINKGVINKIDDLEKRLDEHIKNSSEMELKARRVAILDFGSSIIRGTNYHKEKFDFMINECDSYEKYCKDNEITNGVAQASIEEIRRIYQEHLRNADFLTEKVK